ncbi:MAG: hypothetical protein Tp125DCM114561_35 [Prokaryotic dsDNA virus sp.]|nr:MAG: hypothetical protein Tp125DCM114561_35 [Prokaryotic dsDNA virus sp.]|tara:strand:- start:17806 stop:18393 length:588 start_codon:yes stop_codon:yes gene_type:complete
MTSTAANSAIDIASRALVLIGAEPITAFGSSSTESLVATNMYEDTVRATLSSARWRFASEQAVLAAVGSDPTGRFDKAHQLPTNVLVLHAVTVNDNLVNYTVYGDKVFSNVATADTVVADFTFRQVESEFPSYFSLALEYTLATIFATAIARSSTLARLMNEQTTLLMAKARNLDAQQQTTRKLSTSRFITDRRS